MANRKVIILENYKNLEDSRIFLDVLEFTCLLKSILKDLGLEEKDLKEKTEMYVLVFLIISIALKKKMLFWTHNQKSLLLL